MSLIIFCQMFENNGFQYHHGDKPLTEVREILGCEEDGPECRNCPCLRFGNQTVKG